MNLQTVQRAAPFGRIGRRSVVTLPLDQVHPLIRIAHRRTEALNISERVIFDHEFVLILKGRGRFVTRDQTIPFDAGTLLFIRPFVPHAFESTGRTGEHAAVHFDFTRDFVDPNTDPRDRRPYEVKLAGGAMIPDVKRDVDQTLTDAFVRLVHARSRPTEISPVEEMACLFLILSGVLSGSPDEKGAPPELGERPGRQRDRLRVERAIKYLTEHLVEPLSLDDLATVAGLSESQFTRLFRRHTGYSPMLYLRRARVQRARELLEDPDLAIKEIARRCGFEDAYHFSRVFHQTDGLPPTQYRESVLAGNLKG